jgi:hypothetical protein
MLQFTSRFRRGGRDAVRLTGQLPLRQSARLPQRELADRARLPAAGSVFSS